MALFGVLRTKCRIPGVLQAASMLLALFAGTLVSPGPPAQAQPVARRPHLAQRAGPAAATAALVARNGGTGSISGTVTDATAAPLQGIEVRVYDGSNTFLDSAVTGPLGTYTVGGLPAGTVYALTLDPSGLYADQLHHLYPCDLALCTPNTGTAITVTASTTTAGIDFSLDVLAADFFSITPCRVIDTRSGSPLASGVMQSFTVAGVCGIPTDARAIAAVFTALNPSGDGDLSVADATFSQPGPQVFFSAGVPRAGNGIIVLTQDGNGKLGAIANVAGGGTVHLLADVGGYFKRNVAAPIAFADAYVAAPEEVLSVPAPGVLANDLGLGLQATPIAAGTTTQGGTVTLNADGSLSYTPPAVFLGDDTFDYTVTNASGNDTATVTIHVDERPDVVSTVPTDGSTAVAPTSTVTINFSESVNATATAFKIECPSGTPVGFTQSSSPASTFTLAPNSNLPGGSCTVTVVAAQVSDADFSQHPAADYPFSFSVDADGPPTVTSTVPVNSATTIATNATVTINFSESVNVTASAFNVECPVATPVSFSLIPAAPGGVSSFTLDPTSNLPEGTTCTVTVVASQVTDVDSSQSMAGDYVFTFTTDAAPTVTTTTPTDSATTIATDTNITINFSETVNVTASAFTVECPVSNIVAFSLSPLPPGAVNSFTLDPTSNLPEGTTCTVTVVAAQVSDTDAGDPPDNMASNYVFTFTTDAPPSVTTTSPTNGAPSVATNANITVNFSETVNVTASAFTLECPTGTPEAFSLAPTPPGGVNSFTLDPTSNLPTGTTCTVTVVASQVMDTDAGDPPDNMTANYVFTFTTDAAPIVTTTNPVDGAINVPISSNIVITFSESVNASVSSFTLECPVGNARAFGLSAAPAAPAVARIVSISSGTIFTLNPTVDLPGNTVCTVTALAAGITDVDTVDPPDNPLANYPFSFTTANAPPVPGADSYQTVANTELQVAATKTVADPVVFVTGNVLSNDTDGGDGPGPLSVTGAASGVTAGATVNIASDGTFTYIPPVGQTSDDTFQYTVSDGMDTATGTVTIHFVQRVWYVKNDATAGGLGRSSDPFDTLAEAESASIASDTIYVFEGNGNDLGQNAGVTLKNGQRLIGEGIALTIPASLNGGANPTTLKAAGNRPLVTDNDGSPVGAVIVAASTANGDRTGIEIRGLKLQSFGGHGIGVTTLNAADLGIEIGDLEVLGATGQGISVSVQSTNTTQEISLHDLTVKATGHGFDIFKTGVGVNFYITRFENLTVSGDTGSTSGGSGIEIGGAKFDAIPSTTAFDTVTGGLLVIGASGNGVGGGGGGDGLDMGSVSGNLSFTDMDIYTDGTSAIGLRVTGTGAFNGPAGTGMGISAGLNAGPIVATAGTAVNISSASVNLQLSSIQSTGGANGVSLSSVSDYVSPASPAIFTVTSGSITNATGTDFLISGGNADVTYGGTITDDVGTLVSVASATGGTILFSGAITDGNDGDGSGISLTSNTGATINFTGQLTLSTGGNPAFTATGGGTVSASNTSSTIVTTSGTALNVQNTTIGSSGLHFQSISANGATNGIVLNTTGSSGGLTVSGNGSTTQGGNASGGTIQNTTGAGILLTSTRSVSLNNMTITNTPNAPGIDGTTVTNFSFTNGTVSNSGTTTHGAYDSNIAFNDDASSTVDNLDGTVTITNNVLSNAYQHGVDVLDFSGTLSDLNISTNAITSNTSGASSAGSGMRVQVLGSAGGKADLTKGEFDNNTILNFPNGAGVVLSGGNRSTSGSPANSFGTNSGGGIVSVTGNTIHGQSVANEMGTNCILVTMAGKGTGFVNVSNNGSGTALGLNKGNCISINSTGSYDLTATASNNVVSPQQTSGGGSGISGGADKQTMSDSSVLDTAILKLTASNNTVSNTDGVGIYFLANSTGTLQARMQGNNVAAPTGGVRPAMRVDSGSATASAVNTTVCLEISGNTAAAQTPGSAFDGIALRKVGNTTSPDAFGIVGLSPSPATDAQMQTYIRAQNAGDVQGDPTTGAQINSHSGVPVYTSCTLPF